jgi:hypothetical protein
MATTLFTAWLDDVMPHVGGCPVTVALQKIQQASIAYCRRSRSWRYLGLTPIDAAAGQQTYVLGTAVGEGELPLETVLVHAYQVNYAGVPLDALIPSRFKAQSPTWFDDDGEPEAFTLFNEGEISLWRIPAAIAVGAIVLPEVALAPSQTATGVDAKIFETARDAIATGARGLIHSLPGKPYSDVQLGRALMQDFDAAAGSADASAASGRGHARLRTQTIHR